MSKKRERFEVPVEFRHEYKMLIQRANRRIKSNLKYIDKNNIQDEDAIRSLVGGFGDVDKWQTERMPLSRSNRGRYIWNADTGQMEFRDFQNKTEFEQYLRYLGKWGQATKKGELYQVHPQQLINDYKSAMVRALNEVKDHYSISLPGGKLPQEVLDAIDKMTIEDFASFFRNESISETMEISQFSSDDFIVVDTAEDFTTAIISRIYATSKMNKKTFKDTGFVNEDYIKNVLTTKKRKRRY